jgi:heme iron utilization protein
MMPFAADDRGRPIFFISSLAMHTQNLQHDERSSLLITQPHVSGDPLAAARMTLIGSTRTVPAEEAQELYLARHENAHAWEDFTDFSYYRLDVAGVYFIGGFGVMDWLAPEDYAAAAPDPLARVAPAIMQHMNADHSEALRRIAARETGQFPDEVSLYSVDRLGFHLRLKTDGQVHEKRIPFPREVRDAKQARAVFIEMVRACS